MKCIYVIESFSLSVSTFSFLLDINFVPLFPFVAFVYFMFLSICQKKEIGRMSEKCIKNQCVSKCTLSCCLTLHQNDRKKRKTEIE